MFLITLLIVAKKWKQLINGLTLADKWINKNVVYQYMEYLPSSVKVNPELNIC